MTSLAPLLQAFFTDRLQKQKQVSPETIASYRDTFRLLLGFAHKRLGKEPSDLLLTDIDAPFVGAFLDHLETAHRPQGHRLVGCIEHVHIIEPGQVA